MAWLQYEQLRDSGTLSTTVVDITSYGGGQEYLLSQQQHYQQQPYQQQPESRDGRSKYSKLRSALGANKIAKSSGTSATSAMSSAKDIKVADEYLEEDFFEALPAESAAASQERENQHWVQCVTADGDVYYYNSLTQHVQWENPFEQEDVQVSQQQEAQGEHMQNQMGQTVTHTESTRAGIAGVTTSTSRDHAQAGQAQPAAAISSSTVTSNSNTMKSAAPLTPTASSNRLTTGSSVDGDSASKSVTSKPKRGMVTHNTVAGAEPSLRPTRSITSSPASSSNTGAAAPATPLQQPQQANVHQQSSWSSAGGRNGGGGVGVPAFNTNPQYQYRTSPHAHPQQEAYKYPQHQHVQQHTQQQVLSPSQQQQVEPQYAYPNAATTTVMYQQQQVEDEAEGEGEGDGGSTVGSPMAYNRYTPLGLRTGTVSISSLSDNDNSEYGFGSSVQGSVQGAFVMHHHHSGYQPRSPNQAAIYTPSVGGAGSGESSPVASSAAAKSSAVQPRNKPPAGNIGTAAVNNTTSASPPTGPSSGPQAEPEEASQASTESQTQRHLEIWDRFFRNAMLVNQQQNQDGSGDGAGDETQLSQAAVKASIRKIRQKAALSRSKGATAVARWPHLLSQRRYNALITFALRKHPAVAASSHPSVEAAQEQELLESSSVAGSVNSIDGTLLSMALLAATLHEDVATVEALLHNGANPSCVDDLIRTPAHYACKLGNVALLALLFDHDAQLEATDAAGRTPLHTAAIFGRVTAMEFMLGCAVDCNAADLAGNTALHLAARAGFEDGCRVLLSFGASTVVRNLMGMTALGVAQIMRPQSAALQAVIAVLSNPLAEMPTDYDRRQQTSTSAQNEPVRRPAPQYGGGDGDAYIDYAGGAHGGWDEQGLYNPEYEAQEDYAQGDPYQNQHHQNHQIYQNHPEYQGQDEQQPYHYQYGSDVEGEVEGEGDGDNDGEGDGESGDEGNSVAELVASSVWGVAASLIDITLSMFMNPAAAPATATTSSSPRGGDKSAAGQQRTRSKISDDHDPDAHYSYGDGNPDAHQQRPLRPSAPAPAPYFPAESQRSSSGGGAGITRNIASAPLGAALWQMLGLGGGNQNRDSQLDGALSREQTRESY